RLRGVVRPVRCVDQVRGAAEGLDFAAHRDGHKSLQDRGVREQNLRARSRLDDAVDDGALSVDAGIDDRRVFDRDGAARYRLDQAGVDIGVAGNAAGIRAVVVDENRGSDAGGLDQVEVEELIVDLELALQRRLEGAEVGDRVAGVDDQQPAVAGQERRSVDGSLVDEGQVAVASADIAAAFDEVVDIDKRGTVDAQDEIVRGRPEHFDRAVHDQRRIDAGGVDLDQSGIGQAADRERAGGDVERGAEIDGEAADGIEVIIVRLAGLNDDGVERRGRRKARLPVQRIEVPVAEPVPDEEVRIGDENRLKVVINRIEKAAEQAAASIRIEVEGRAELIEIDRRRERRQVDRA